MVIILIRYERGLLLPFWYIYKYKRMRAVKRVAEDVDPYEIKGRAVGAIIDRPFFVLRYVEINAAGASHRPMLLFVCRGHSRRRALIAICKFTIFCRGTFCPNALYKK